jgi:hypothetical protein
LTSEIKPVQPRSDSSPIIITASPGAKVAGLAST